MGSLSLTHKPDYNLTDPPVSIPPQPSWADPKKIVSFDPWGHLVPSVFKKEMEELGLDARPSIAITKAHMKLSEIDDSVRKGTLELDGKVLLKSRPLLDETGKVCDADPGVEMKVSKAAVEPVWFLPGVAERFQMFVQSLPAVLRRLTPLVDPRVFSVAPCLKKQAECTLNSSLGPILKFSFLPSAA